MVETTAEIGQGRAKPGLPVAAFDIHSDRPPAYELWRPSKKVRKMEEGSKFGIRRCFGVAPTAGVPPAIAGCDEEKSHPAIAL
jgi:hypothetical protein